MDLAKSLKIIKTDNKNKLDKSVEDFLINKLNNFNNMIKLHSLISKIDNCNNNNLDNPIKNFLILI